MIPAFGIIDAYGGFTAEYYNALGFFILCEFNICAFLRQRSDEFHVLVWGVFNLFFLIASIRL